MSPTRLTEASLHAARSGTVLPTYNRETTRVGIEFRPDLARFYGIARLLHAAGNLAKQRCDVCRERGRRVAFGGGTIIASARLLRGQRRKTRTNPFGFIEERAERQHAIGGRERLRIGKSRRRLRERVRLRRHRGSAGQPAGICR